MTALLLILLGACRAPLGDLRREAALTPAAVATCAHVALEARRQGVRPGLAARQAYRESRFRWGLVSPRGAVGPLQVIPGYWCPRKSMLSKAFPCDLVRAGVGALAYYVRKARGDERLALCWYTGRRGCG